MRLWPCALLVLAALGAPGCRKDSARQRSSPESSPQQSSNAGEDAAAAASRRPDCPDPMPLRHPAAERVVAIGDLHGDLEAARWALLRAKAMDEEERWVGGNLVVVQTGDILDRGDGEKEILELLSRLEPGATAAGGKILALNGNHELMNGLGDFRYVTPGGFEDYAAGAATPEEGRLRAFRPGGTAARDLASSGIAVIVGDTLYVHGGIEPDWASTQRLESENRNVQCWLAGATSDVPAAAMDPSGPVWSRAFGVTDPDCEALGNVLRSAGVDRMVVGHTVQPGGVTSACDGQLWRIDVGLSAHYGGGAEILELRGDDVQILRGAR